MNIKNVGRHLFLKKRISKPGDPPGNYTHKKDAIPSIINTYTYDKTSLEQTSKLPHFKDIQNDKYTWIAINGHGNREIFSTLETEYGIHPLVLEDVINTTQLPKVEDYEDYLFIVSRIPSINQQEHTEQIILIVFDNIIISIQEWEHDYLAPIHKRMKNGKPRIRSGPSYLAYAVLDLIVDSYFPIIEEDTEKLDRIEEAVLNDPGVDIAKETVSFKRICTQYRKIIFLAYETVLKLYRTGFTQINEDVYPFLRDCADHANQVSNGFDTLNSRISDIFNLQISLSGARLNEVMKYLTLIATIFIPLTFIAGIYGMNFNNNSSPFNMPELNWYFGYPFVMLVMVVLVVFQIIVFRKKGWLEKIKKNKNDVL